MTLFKVIFGALYIAFLVSLAVCDADYRTAVFVGLVEYAPLFMPMAILWGGLQAAKVAKAQADTAKQAVAGQSEAAQQSAKIALGQARTAKLAAAGQRKATTLSNEVARKKLKLDLFHKRYEFHSEISRIIKEAIGPQVSSDHLVEFGHRVGFEITTKMYVAEWLFDKPIAALVAHNLRDAIIELCANRHSGKSKDDIQRYLNVLISTQHAFNAAIGSHMKLED